MFFMLRYLDMLVWICLMMFMPCTPTAICIVLDPTFLFFFLFFSFFHYNITRITTFCGNKIKKCPLV